jgi:hypothetical protein
MPVDMRHYLDLVDIGRAGGSIVVPPEKTYPPEELVHVAEAIRIGGGKLIIQDAGRYEAVDLVAVCRAAPTQVYVYE